MLLFISKSYMFIQKFLDNDLYIKSITQGCKAQDTKFDRNKIGESERVEGLH
jgi:hypothetical protein